MRSTDNPIIVQFRKDITYYNFDGQGERYVQWWTRDHPSVSAPEAVFAARVLGKRDRIFGLDTFMYGSE